MNGKTRPAYPPVLVIRVGMLMTRDAFRGVNAEALRQMIKQWATPRPVLSI